MKTVRLWKNGQLKELSRSMFSDADAFQTALDFWYGEGWDDVYPNNVE